MGSYTSVQNGKPVTVQVTDGEILKDVADLWAIVKGEYEGTPSMQSEQLKSMLANLQSGRPLNDAEFGLLARLRDRYASALAKFRAGADGNAEGYVTAPEAGTGRILEALPLLSPSARERLRENQPREDRGRWFGGSRIYDPLLLTTDSLHAAAAAQDLLESGRVRVAGQGPLAKRAVDDLTRRVKDKARVEALAVKGNPYTQLKATK
jgi:hypothetical protein